MSSCLPPHGRVACSQCYSAERVEFDRSKEAGDGWRITANPMAWGNTEPEVVVLGFSKGPTQAGSLATTPHDEVAFKGARKNVGKILAHVGLLRQGTDEQLKRQVDRLISERQGRFHFSSFVRCTVERFDAKQHSWEGSGGGMLDGFVSTVFGRRVVTNCASRFLRDLPRSVRLVVLFGLGTNLNYVESAYKVLSTVRPGPWKRFNKVAYTDGRVTVVHVEHFKSQGSLVPDRLGVSAKPRAEFGLLAQQAVAYALAQ